MQKDDKFLKNLLLEEMEKEAEKIKQEVAEDPNLAGLKPSADLKKRILEKAEELKAEQEAYEHLSESDREALMLGRELQMRREERESAEFSEELVPEITEELLDAAGAEGRHTDQAGGIKTEIKMSGKGRGRKRRKKAVIGLAATLIAVLGLGVTSFGDKGYVADTVNQLLGGRKSTNIDTKHKGQNSTNGTREEDVFQQIKDEFGFDAVRMDYKPVDMEMVEYNIDKMFLISNLYYEYGENVLTYNIVPVYQDLSAGYDIEDKALDEYFINVNGVKINITEYLVSDLGKEEYSAKFQYQDVVYTLTGIIEKEEFEKILKNLHFF